MHVDLRPREGDVLQCLLHLGRPLLHQVVDVGHLLGIVHCWWGTGLVQVLHTVDPARDLLGLLISMLNRLDIHGCCANDVTLLDVSQFNNGLIFRIQCWLVQYRDTKVFFGTVWLGHLQEGIDLTN